MADTTRVQTDRGLLPVSAVISKVSTRYFDINASAITVNAGWQGQCVRFLKACTVTVPDDLPDDFDCAWSQEAAGQITFVAASGVTIQSVDGALKSSGQFALGGMSAWGTKIVRLYGSLTA